MSKAIEDTTVGERHTVLQEVARTLAAMGAKRCFGLVGGANFKVTYALRELGVEFIAARHEGNAVTMADAAARLSGELTLVSVTAGPGLTNGITGIAEAAKSRTPLLVIAGDVAMGDIHSSFYIQQEELVRSVGALWIQIDSSETAIEKTFDAASQALEERRTVILSLPIDVQEKRVVTRQVAARTDAKKVVPLFANRDEFKRVADAISGSCRPLILAGRGAVIAEAERDLIELGDRIGALFATTVQAHGMFAGNPWSLGISGGFSSQAARELIPRSDLVLAFGATLNSWTTRKGKFFSPNATVVQIDIDRSSLGLNYRVDISVEADAAISANAIVSALQGHGADTQGYFESWRSGETKNLIELGSNHRFHYQDTSSSERLDPRTLSKAVDAILPTDRIVVCDGGHFVGWPARYLRVPDQRSWCMPVAFQSIGLGLATAIGANASQPGRLTVLAVGDGGFLMSLADLETAVRLQQRICILLYNDSAYGAEVHHFARMGYSTSMAQFPETDFARIAHGFGARGIVVRSVDDLEPLRQWVAEGAAGVFLIDAKIDPALEADWYREAFAATDSV